MEHPAGVNDQAGVTGDEIVVHRFVVGDEDDGISGGDGGCGQGQRCQAGLGGVPAGLGDA